MSTVAEIIAVVSEVWRVEANEILSPRRARRVSQPRQAAYSLSREFTDYSFTRIAPAFGRRDHTTILYGIKRARSLRQNDPAFAALYQEAHERLKRRVAVAP